MKQIKIEDIKVGDKAIKANGLLGRITDIDTTCQIANCPIAFIAFENGTYGSIYFDDTDLSNFYLIGTTIIGNKIEVENIKQQIEENKKKLERIKIENAQLRKQEWRLKNVMTGVYPLPKDYQ